MAQFDLKSKKANVADILRKIGLLSLVYRPISFLGHRRIMLQLTIL